MDFFCDCVYNCDERISQIGNLALLRKERTIL